MKKFFLTICLGIFFTAGVSSCADEAAEVVPQIPADQSQMTVETDGGTTRGGDTTRPK